MYITSYIMALMMRFIIPPPTTNYYGPQRSRWNYGNAAAAPLQCLQWAVRGDGGITHACPLDASSVPYFSSVFP